MRKRSNTIYAQTLEDFHAIADNPNIDETLLSNIPNLNKRNSSLSSVCSIEEAEPEAGGDLWDDFEYTCSPTLTSRLSLKKRSTILSRLSMNEQKEEIPVEQQAKSSVVKKVMVIGQRGSGKHFLINSAFHSDENPDSLAIQQTMDLILKTEEEADGTLETKYQFWIRTLDEHRFDSLIKVYYKIVSVFVFVYSTADRSSFEALGEAIDSVTKEVSREKFVGVLIANTHESKADNKHSEVSSAEGLALQQKYNLKLFMDSNEGEDVLREKLHDIINVKN